MKKFGFLMGITLMIFSLVLVSEASAASRSSNSRISSRASSPVITNFASLSNKAVSNNNFVSGSQASINNNPASSSSLISASEVTPGMFGEDGGYNGSYRFPVHVDIYDGFLTLGLGSNSGIRFTVDAGAQITQVLSTPLNPSVLRFQYGGQYNFDGNVIAAEPTKSNHLTTKNYVDSSDISVSRITPGIFQSGEYRFPGTLVANELRFMPDRGPVLRLGDNMLKFINGNTYYFDDKVGINTPNPDATLRVNGTLKANYYIAYNGKYGITNNYKVKDSGGGNCVLSFTNGLLTYSNCSLTEFSGGSNSTR
jgi:hypothetical protein